MPFELRIPEELVAPAERKTFESALIDALRRHPRHSIASHSAVTTLLDISGLDDENASRARSAIENYSPDFTPAIDAAIHVTDTTAGALTTTQVAAHLQVAPSTVRRRVDRGELLAHRGTRVFRLPHWQFTPTGTLPQWRLIATHLQHVDLRATEAFVHEPREDLEGMSVRAWLLDGRDPEKVERLAQSLSRW
ncbi:helix-turn-helix domain-containing protein [Demequina sp. NBRC 110055]|uniref:helix-turn-helix domain-containing protein n=1 Tax=Demequina sp. NBRC 110055 TaxID=1570344 RepID=UPI000A058BE8|nr:helix-turn-helix domain-containing protein [Demequina sp. NBRC 110055]